ncbi:MAG: hypothetical protein E7388_01210 [Ruminococcaceae bacterium]|nr:hypothetical protein [Oscillospiraceae bacterium]
MKFLKNTINKGSVTIFISILLSGILFLNSVLIDAARIITAKTNIEYKLILAGKSILAAYESVLFEYYGLICINGSEDPTMDLDYYFNIYRNTININESQFLNINPFTGNAECFYSEFTESLDDINILQKQIISLMKYKTPGNMLEKVLESVNILNSGEKANEGEFLYKEACNYLEELANKSDSLFRLVEGWSDNDVACVNGFSNNISRSLTIADIKAKSMQLSLFDDNSLLDLLKKDCIKLKSDFETYSQLNKNAVNLINEINGLHNEIEICINKINKWLAEYKPESEMGGDYSNKLKERVNELKDILQKTQYNSSLKKLNENIYLLEDNIVKIMELYEIFGKYDGFLSYEIIEKNLKDADCLKMNTNIKIYNGRENEKFILPKNNPAENQVSEEDVLKNLDGLFEIEESLKETLPSVVKNKDEIEIEKNDSLTKVLIDDYILSYFGNYKETVQNITACFNAETEYILNGESSEKKNIEKTFLKIFSIRTGLNLIHVLCDSEKRQIANAMGNAIAGATYGIGGPLYAALIMTAWASGEALIDINRLKKGESVPLIKKSDDWRLSIEGLSSKNEKENSEILDFDYKEYLRLLLYLTPQKIKLLRIQDLIEINMSKYIGNRFYLGNYYNSLRVGCNYIMSTSFKEIEIKEYINVCY